MHFHIRAYTNQKQNQDDMISHVWQRLQLLLVLFALSSD